MIESYLEATKHIEFLGSFDERRKWLIEAIIRTKLNYAPSFSDYFREEEELKAAERVDEYDYDRGGYKPYEPCCY